MKITVKYYPNEEPIDVDLIDIEDIEIDDGDDAYDEWVDNQLSMGEEI